MKQYFILLKLQIRSQFRLGGLKKGSGSGLGGALKKIGMAVLILFALAELLGVYTFMMLSLYQGAKALNSPEIVLTVSAACCALVIFAFGIFFILSVLFFAKDSEFLISLPVRQNHIFATKFTLIALREYPITLFIMLPPVIIYGIGSGRGAAYYVLALCAIILLPMIPLALSSFLSLLMMRAVARMRHREVFATIGGILIFVLVFFGQTMLSSRLSSSNSAELVKAMTARGGLVTQASRLYPPSEWLTFALSGNSAPKYFLYLLGLSAAAVYIVIALSSRIYQKGMQVQFESPKGSSRKKYRFSSSSPVITIVRNEWISIIKTPVYAMNTLLGIILAPLVLIMPAFSGGSDTSSMIRLLHILFDRFRLIAPCQLGADDVHHQRKRGGG
ncbi:MAG TPA: hypothetical protein VHR42_04215, partial [Clostridia bacterium]|nr:hypothetical protein [Clostridia bacterium]